MRQVAVRPIRPSGWAFPLPTLNHQLFFFMKWRLYAHFLLLLILVGIQLAWISGAQAQHHVSDHNVSYETDVAHDSRSVHAAGCWEGSTQGIAYSEFNHRFVGLFVILIGFLNWAMRCDPRCL
jgi:hypothetical protein